MTAASEKKGVIHLLQEFSIPLILGVVAALVYANLNYETYEHLIHLQVSNWVLFGHDVTLHFLINDIFMVFFFGIAAKEITEAVLPGGDLNPPKKAINPLMGTLGGVVGPVGVYFLLTMYMSPDKVWYDAVANGWGIPTATDIALAWLIARIIFGNTHPAVNFLLLLAVADDAIGLGIIAVFYPDPAHMPEPIYLLYLFGAPLPDRMDLRHLTVAGIVAGLGLTVALFVAGEAFQESHNIMHQGPAKMGAVFSAIAAFVAIVVARGIGIKRED